ncbi:suppressor protein SRP40 isoform X2 [Lucilia cuprina]|uniref:suppressor protein SRP40 isoform X2 n=1 Tax=Lucilia cuprina TaxID=7375 RepID=UPI001F071170|nr:suppressor protein SRP40 isoform X2 [Lucilia cuprina]
MPWIPTTDFEEEVVNLQPHHDFIYGMLSEPQYNSYPRPKTHTEYAANRKTDSKEHRKSTAKLNGKLHAIQQVQRMASTKTETIGMMRYCGMGVSVEQPLNQKVTMATYPVENKIKLVQNGRRKVALFFDDNVFKLKEKVSDTSSGFDSCNNSNSSQFKNNPNDSSVSEPETSCNTSFVSTTSSLNNIFSTAGDNSDSFSTASQVSNTSPTIQLKAKRLQQYHKLLEDTALLSLNSSISSEKHNADSFETAEDIPRWKPISDDDENVFDKPENWPVLNRNHCNKNSIYSKEIILNKTQSDSGDDVSSVTISSSSSSSSNKQAKRINFLQRFIKSEHENDDLNTSNTSSESAVTNPPDPSTYAAITKTSKQSTPKRKEKIYNSSNEIIDFQPFYTTRRMYALKRHVK